MRVHTIGARGIEWSPTPPVRDILLLVGILALGACGTSDPIGAEPDPDVAPFVGDWDAVEFRVTNLANEAQTLDIVQTGSFTLVVEPSGFYTAILHISGSQPIAEDGRLRVIGSSVLLDPSNGTSVSSAYAFDGPDRVTLDGPTEFDFNSDGEVEAATAHIVLQRR